MGNLLNLRRLYLGANLLGGTIPPELGNLVNLRRLYLDGNLLSGNVPPELGNLHDPTALSLYGNRLNGQVPPELLANMTKLTWLSLDGNRLMGCVPTALRDQLPGIGGHLRGLPFCDQVPPSAPLHSGNDVETGGLLHHRHSSHEQWMASCVALPIQDTGQLWISRLPLLQRWDRQRRVQGQQKLRRELERL